MTMRLDIVTNDAGDLVRRDHARRRQLLRERDRDRARLPGEPVGFYLDGAEDERRALRHELQILIAWGLRWERPRALPGAFRFWSADQTPELYRLDIYFS